MQPSGAPSLSQVEAPSGLFSLCRAPLPTGSPVTIETQQPPDRYATGYTVCADIRGGSPNFNENFHQT